nr:MAG TPA: hypothetical protein [Caudoviricetes sp.]
MNLSTEIPAIANIKYIIKSSFYYRSITLGSCRRQESGEKDERESCECSDVIS